MPCETVRERSMGKGRPSFQPRNSLGYVEYHYVQGLETTSHFNCFSKIFLEVINYFVKP